jgi:predicted DNA-binding protein with PD1-like motif
MRSRLLNENGIRAHLLAFEPGDEVIAMLERFAHDRRVSAASVRAIGGFSAATLAFFDPHGKVFVEVPVHEQSEVVSLLGDIALTEDLPTAHVHAALGLRSGEMRGGHLIRGIVCPTLELLLTESPAYLRKRFDPELGVPLIEVPSSERWLPPSGVRH